MAAFWAAVDSLENFGFTFALQVDTKTALRLQMLP